MMATRRGSCAGASAARQNAHLPPGRKNDEDLKDPKHRRTQRARVLGDGKQAAVRARTKTEGMAEKSFYVRERD